MVDKDLYNPQQLIEDVLINSGCIENIEVKNVYGGNFSDGDKSFGYFENNNSNFPFERGIVMSTGRLSNVPGPNNGLSDDNAPGWIGDDDLENYLDLDHTVNATILEFEFTPLADNIRFRYIFASEEYRENQSTTCQYSDAFAFLIRPVESEQYENLAVIPGTDIPVKVTTVHPEIPGSCPAQNEDYFEGFNSYESPIIFNGQTTILTAETEVIPGQTYHIKLVIADEINYRFDSAVFLEAESFNIGANLGEDIYGLCEGETHLLEPLDIGAQAENYKWFLITDQEEILLEEGPDQNSFEVQQSGTYKVVIEYAGSCAAEDIIQVFYEDFSSLQPIDISSCIQSDQNLQGFVYNLMMYENLILQGNSDYHLQGFFYSEEDALSEINSIDNPEIFHSQFPGQKVFARIVTERGCLTSLEISLQAAEESIEPVHLFVCPDEDSFSQFSFQLTDAIAEIQDQLDVYIDYFEFYETEQDAFYQENPLASEISLSKNELPFSVFIRIDGALGCQGLGEIILNDLEKPQIDPSYSPPAFCDDNQQAVVIEAGIVDAGADYLFLWENGADTPTIEVDAPGEYQVTVSQPHIISGDTLYCTLSRKIEVKNSEKPLVDYILHGDPGNYEVEILVSGIGDYVFSVDDLPWSMENRYPIDSGKHDIRVKDLNGCGTIKKSFYAIDYMKFFTPNNDGINDFWKILDDHPKNSQIKNIEIFDRYGKLIIVLGPHDEWNGTFHGNPLPSNDYWFKINFKNGKIFKRNFSLIR